MRLTMIFRNYLRIWFSKT